MGLKVAISGAHGTGKTTLLNALVAADRALTSLPEIPRLLVDLADDPVQLRRGNNTLENQLAIICAQMAHEGELVAQGARCVISDRTVGDHWAYTEALFPAELARAELRLTHDSVVRWLHTYDLVFFIPPEFAPVDDGVRESDLDFRDEIHQILSALYNDAGVHVVTVTGSVDQRRDTVLDRVAALSKSEVR